MIKAKLTKLTLSVTVTVLFTQTMSTQHSTAQQTMIKLPTSSSISCDEAIKSTKANLKQKGLYEPRMFLKGVPRPYRIEPSITFNDTDIEHYYYNYPVDRKRTVYIRTAGELYKLANLFDSPQFMTIISSKIIKACPQVGIVFLSTTSKVGNLLAIFLMKLPVLSSGYNSIAVRILNK